MGGFSASLFSEGEPKRRCSPLLLRNPGSPKEWFWFPAQMGEGGLIRTGGKEEGQGQSIQGFLLDVSITQQASAT